MSRFFAKALSEICDGNYRSLGSLGRCVEIILSQGIWCMQLGHFRLLEQCTALCLALLEQRAACEKRIPEL